MPQEVQQISEKNKWLNIIGAVDEGTRSIVEMVEAIFHIEDLFTLAKNNSFIALNFYQMIANIDYVLFVAMTHDINQKIQPAGETNLAAEVGSVLTGTGAQFPNTLEGTLLAISHCFKIQAAKMDTLIDVNVLKDFMQGTGAAQIAQDACNALLNGAGALAKAIPLAVET